MSHRCCLVQLMPDPVLADCCAGIIGQLVNDSADLALFPLPIQADVTDYIDYTEPFLDGGISIMVLKGTYQPSPFGFLGPFSWQVSLTTMNFGQPCKSCSCQIHPTSACFLPS